MRFETKKLDASTYQITATIPFKRVQETFDHVLDHFVEHAEIKGFRKGKAPKEEVEKAADKSKLYGEVINHLAPEAYNQAIKENHIKPIISPRIRIKQFDYDSKKDLILEITTCVKPEMKLGNYQTSDVGRRKTDEKNKKKSSDIRHQSSDKSEKEAAALKKLLETSDVAVPKLLIDEEVNRSMSKLIDQTKRMGLTVEQYMKSSNKTPETLRAEYAQQARQALKQEFVLLEIAQKEGIKATDKDIGEIIKAAGDENVQQQLRKPEHKSYLESIIVKRKVIESVSK